jgi:hypothetical protein
MDGAEAAGGLANFKKFEMEPLSRSRKMSVTYCGCVGDAISQDLPCLNYSN